MKLVSCSDCFKNFPKKDTTIREGKRICRSCMKRRKENSISFFNRKMKRGE